jgi:GGDEF domain-containing protein
LIVERFQKKLDEFNTKKKLRTVLSVSVGVTYCDPECPYAITDLLDKADQAMYEQNHRIKTRRLKHLLSHVDRQGFFKI